MEETWGRATVAWPWTTSMWRIYGLMLSGSSKGPGFVKTALYGSTPVRW